MNLDVWSRGNETFFGTLTEPYTVQFTDEIGGPGVGTFKLDVASEADLALLTATNRRHVRFRFGAEPGDVDVWSGIVQDMPSDLAADIEPETGAAAATVTVQLEGALSRIGYTKGGAVQYPYGGMIGRQQNPRLWGPFYPDYNDDWWGGPSVGGPVNVAGWPDPSARYYLFPAGTNALWRRFLPPNPEVSGPGRLFITAPWDIEVTVWLEGQVVLTKKYGDVGIFYVDAPYEDLEHFICIHAKAGHDGIVHSEGKVAFTWMRLITVLDDDGNETVEVGTALRRFFSGADFPNPDSNWKALTNFARIPGVTTGFVMDRLLGEDSGGVAGGHDGYPRTWWWQFGEDYDSAGNPWLFEYSRGFRLANLGNVLDEACSIEGEPAFGPSTNEIQVFRWLGRGQDRTGEVTVSAPYDLRLSGRGVQATRWLFETGYGGGLGTAVHPSDTGGSSVMEQFVQLGTDISPETIEQAVLLHLNRDANRRSEVLVDLPDTVAPYHAACSAGPVPAAHVVQMGDRVSCVTLDGVQRVRLVAFLFDLDDDNGAYRWQAVCQPDESDTVPNGVVDIVGRYVTEAV
jgi:hypothetical protein